MGMQWLSKKVIKIVYVDVLDNYFNIAEFLLFIEQFLINQWVVQIGIAKLLKAIIVPNSQYNTSKLIILRTLLVWLSKEIIKDGGNIFQNYLLLY